MNISLNWLKQHVDLKNTKPEKIGEFLTLHTAEVEEVKNPADDFANIVVGQVKQVKKHPNADKLVLATVTDGAKDWEVVCGGTNVKQKMLVALARPGAKVRWHGEGDLVALQEAEIRGVKSAGMICSPQEIGLERHFECPDKEVLDLTPFGLKVGENLGRALELDDWLFEIENKTITHRPDLWSHFGFARELAALLKTKLKESHPPSPNGFGEASPPLLKSFNEANLSQQKNFGKREKISVEVKDKKACPRYMAVKIDNVKIVSSPLWLKAALFKAGTRSINNIVDLTNFIMFDLGQPLHAFDAAKIAGPKIIVRKAKKGERITTLDEEILELNSEDLLICDKEKPVALAGVMGGRNSEIDQQTTSLILEAANFDAPTVRRTSLRFNLRTEASMRFEKGQDPALAEMAVNKFLAILAQLCPEAKITAPVVDIKNHSLRKNVIKVNLERVNQKAGVRFTANAVKKTLEPLGFGVSGSGQNLNVTVPSWRSQGDVALEDDLIEELTRIYGFDNIKPVLPQVQINRPEENRAGQLEQQIKNFLSLGCGLNEVLNYSFLGEDRVKNPEKHLALKNPVNKEQNLLRQSLIAGLRQNAEDNLRFFENFGLFEIGSVYFKETGDLPADISGKTKLPRQEKHLAGVLVGTDQNLYLEAKGMAEALYKNLGLKYQPEMVHFVTDSSLEKPAVFFEINLSELLNRPAGEKTFKELPRFPGVIRDLAFLIDKKTPYAQIEKTIKEAGANFLVKVNLFDAFRGKNIADDKKSLAFHLEFRSPQKTLTAQEADEELAKIIEALEGELKAKIRK